MLNTRIRIMLLLMMSMGLWMLKTHATSADLVAERKVQGNHFSITTLSFININTANFSQLISFFNTDGIVPGGFDAKTIRIEKDGKMHVQYSLLTIERGGNTNFCHTLDLQIVRRDLTEVYNGKLMNLSLQDNLQDGDIEEWILFLSLSASDDSLKNKQCDFDLYMRTYRNSPGENFKGIHAKRTLTSTVTSG